MTALADRWPQVSKDPFPGRVPCMAHTLQLAVKEILKIPELEDVRERCRNIVTHMHKSPLASTQLTSHQISNQEQQHKLIQVFYLLIFHTFFVEHSKLTADVQEVDTRWNSTFHMFQRVCIHEASIRSTLINGASHLLLPEGSTNIINEVQHILHMFEAFTTELSKECSICAPYVYPVVSKLLTHTLNVTTSDSPWMRKLKQRARADIVSRFGEVKNIRSLSGFEKSFLLASALHPATSDLTFASESVKAQVWQYISEKCASLQPSESTAAQTQIESTKPAIHTLLGMQSPQRHTLHTQEILSFRRECSSDLPEVWWQRNGKDYPILRKLALQYFTVQATSVPSERVFSASGNIVSDRRARLSPEHINQLVVLHSWLKLQKKRDQLMIIKL